MTNTPIPEMVERVARRLQSRDRHFAPDEALDPAYVEDARAAIEEMRVPTQEMLAAAELLPMDKADDANIYTAMIDKVLGK